jgi:lanosterol synthase
MVVTRLGTDDDLDSKPAHDLPPPEVGGDRSPAQSRLGGAAGQGELPEIPPEAVEQALRDGFGWLARIQRPAGCVVGEVVWSPILTAQYVMTAAMTGQEIPEDRKARFLRYFEVWQQEDGGWGLHAESPSYLYVTTLVYVALRAMGRGPDDPRCARARSWIREQGGVLAIPSWGKAWLAMFNLYDWRAVSPVLPELWLLPEGFPAHPSRMYCHTRLIYLGLGYLYGVGYQQPVTPLVEALRDELYPQPYAEIPFARHRFDLAASDLFEAPPPLLKAVYALCGVYDRVRSKALRERALSYCLHQIVAHQRQSRYAAISPVNGLLNCLALHHAGHEDFQPSFQGVDYWAWRDEEEGERFNGAHSHSWDTAFALQALYEGPLVTEHAEAVDPFLERAARYLTRAQQTEEIPERQRFHRDPRLGGWCFSDEHHRWPVSDCTAEALSALRYLADTQPREQLPSPERIVQAARFLLTRQNADGGWGSYERGRGGRLLKSLNPSEMFGNCMVEYSYVECTASCMQALRHTLDGFRELLSDGEIRRFERAIARGEALLRRTQEAEGGWPGFWGVNYTYGTLFGVSGLLAAGASRTDPAIERACAWLVAHRLPDGGWGESWRGCLHERYIPHDESQVIMTAWALMTLLRAGYEGPGAREAVSSGVQLLLDRQLEDGDWPKEGVGGVFFNTAFHHYMLYKNYFPLWALGLYAKRR